MVVLVLGVTAYLSIVGYSYYDLPIEERFYHPQYEWFKPSGVFGHGLGIVGTFLITFGVLIYIARKNYGFLERYIRIKYLLEFHIFLCTLGPIMILFHTSFKFGGIVSIAFWSMVAVVVSGVVGRFIYIQIPRNIQGQALGLDQLKNMQQKLVNEIESLTNFSQIDLEALLQAEGSLKLKSAKYLLNEKSIPKKNAKKIIKVLKDENKLNKRITRLNQMQKLFKYWHVAHKPFALIMLIIVIVHVVVTLLLGYKWIF
tara:strand:+ start:153 stop:923 length:771 start_codon:yes stop_codon:yes gene_type:complete